jgi:hypothetical protein
MTKTKRVLTRLSCLGQDETSLGQAVSSWLDAIPAGGGGVFGLRQKQPTMSTPRSAFSVVLKGTSRVASFGSWRVGPNFACVRQSGLSLVINSDGDERMSRRVYGVIARVDKFPSSFFAVASLREWKAIRA